MDRFDVFVIGAGAIRVEFAQICLRFGNQVTLVEDAVGNLLGLESGPPACRGYVVREHGRDRISIAAADPPGPTGQLAAMRVWGNRGLDDRVSCE